MKKSRILIVIVLAIFLSASSLLAENVPIKKANYKLAARFSPDKIKKMVFSTSVSPHWLKHSDRFWYTFETPEGKSYYIVNPVRKSKMLLFDNVKMAAMLTMMTKDPYDAEHLPIEKIKFVKKDTAIQFEVESSQDEEKIKKEEKVEEEEKKEKEEEKAEKEKPKKKIFGFEYNIATGKLTMLKDYKKPEEKPKWASISYISMCDSNRFFIDNYSRVNTVPKSKLCNNLGNKIFDLETADLSTLMAAGFKFPEPFKVKANDGITDLYGVMYKPFDFDKDKKYPIIAYVYPGPQTESVSKSFSTSGDRNFRLAQFGFVVITVGNRGGHPSRSKWYHNYGYGNLRDYGLADKKAAIEKLAERCPFIDIDKVGIFGHSGGGFMSTAAMLVYPDFFKVAVSSSGNHENNIYNRWWSEKHHGVKEVKDDEGNIKFEYDIEKNSELAKNLKGHLLLTTGDIDNNVHPGCTISMANALIRANKRFDFFVFPGQRHGYGNMNDYFFWLRSDYFCRYLIGDYSQSVDVVELNREKEMSGSKEKK